MANSNAPRGLVPYRYASGAPYNGSTNLYAIPASDTNNYFLGDPVIPTGTADANGIPYVSIATAGTSNAILGPFVSINNGGNPVVAVTRDMPIYRQASVLQYVNVADDPNLLFWVQEFGNMGTTAVFGNVNLTAGAGGSTITGESSWQLVSTVSTSAGFQMRVRSLLFEADNAPGTNAKWLCSINQHVLALGSAGV